MNDDFDFDFGNESDDYRGRNNLRGCGCLVGLVVGVIVALFATLWLVQHRRQVEIAVFVGCVGTAAYLARQPLLDLVQRLRFGKGVDSTAVPVPLASIQPGQAVHTAGLIGLGLPPLQPPFGAPACVWYRVVVERVDEPGGVVFTTRSSDELVLEDGMGAKLAVRIDGARWLVKRRQEIVSSPDEPIPQILSFLAERGITNIRRDEYLRAYVEWIAPRELVFVRGIVRDATEGESEGGYRTGAQASRLELSATPDHPVFIALQPLGARSSSS